MRKLAFLYVVLILSVGFALGRLSHDHDPAAHAGSPGCPPGSVNGDVNGDSTLDVSDAVYLLNSLFAGGPAPCDNRSDLAVELAACRAELEACQRALADCHGEELQWYTTCGDPVCGGYRGPVDGVPLCTDEEEGMPCDEPGALCDLQDDCNRRLICAARDPKLDGCPISRRRYKRDIDYLSEAEQDRMRERLLELRVASWNYVWDAPVAKARLGFLIDDTPDAPAVEPGGERVDLYSYTSMAVAAIQSQGRQLKELRAELAALREGLKKMHFVYNMGHGGPRRTTAGPGGSVSDSHAPPERP